jgi:hypothetical protein
MAVRIFFANCSSMGIPRTLSPRTFAEAGVVGKRCPGMLRLHAVDLGYVHFFLTVAETYVPAR